MMQMMTGTETLLLTGRIAQGSAQGLQGQECGRSSTGHVRESWGSKG